MNQVLDQIRKLDDQRSKLLGEAKDEALQLVHEAIGDLNALGFNYGIVEKARERRGGGRQQSDGPCPICEFKTNPPHDGRKHRSQGNRKKPFSTQELEKFGLKKV
jgi:hypothetical protein